jgi:hypothetical protein
MTVRGLVTCSLSSPIKPANSGALKAHHNLALKTFPFDSSAATTGHLEKPHLAAPSLKSHRPDTFPSTPDEIA